MISGGMTSAWKLARHISASGQSTTVWITPEMQDAAMVAATLLRQEGWRVENWGESISVDPPEQPYVLRDSLWPNGAYTSETEAFIVNGTPAINCDFAFC